MKKVTMIQGFIALMCMVVGHSAIAQISTEEMDKGLAQIAKTFNEKGAVLMDEMTRLDSVGSLPGRRIIYNYTLLNPKKEQRDYAALQKLMAPGILNTVKTNPQMGIFRENDVVMIYNYYGEDTKRVFTIEISPKDYK